jgi:hypothetical protein
MSRSGAVWRRAVWAAIFLVSVVACQHAIEHPSARIQTFMHKVASRTWDANRLETRPWCISQKKPECIGVYFSQGNIGKAAFDNERSGLRRSISCISPILFNIAKCIWHPEIAISRRDDEAKMMSRNETIARRIGHSRFGISIKPTAIQDIKI